MLHEFNYGDSPVRSLREEVYEHLRGLLTQGRLPRGKFLNLNALAKQLGTSRTPLRDALLRLESEGFVDILNRRGVRIRELTLDSIRDIYEILGGLESSALRTVADLITPEIVTHMEELNRTAACALASGDHATAHNANVDFHDAYLDLSSNAKMIRWIHILKQRLHDFPRRRGSFPEWDQASLAEHEELVRLLQEGRIVDGADFLRDVHWSFRHQERFIRPDFEARRREAAGEVESSVPAPSESVTRPAVVRS
jgi:DNA-binding GntR family transcriptional regulator